MKKPTRHSSPAPTRKKRYRQPQLTVHGDLRRLTQVKMGTNMDGAGRPMTRGAMVG
jgi:hypothetical protein